ncbi:hypothetical protein BDZ94DRAFT_1306734 [Collybia nuda]|uniref:Ubiquitin 3 binding protein But2 C-terminal domain-containing protein n=1 Tax=Collybia nuda TaxID=64659 RepID=A0A9P5YB40_9AGAR|nr:hypothetical protein BDZ94DRAFT_1306734 [Collybia nuda]
MHLVNSSGEFQLETMYGDEEQDRLLPDGCTTSLESSVVVERKPRSPMAVVIALLILLVTVDIGACLYIGYYLHIALSYQDLEVSEYRNPYVNLEKLYSLKNSTTRYKPIVNTPRLAVQVSSLHPDHLYDPKHHIYEPKFGTLSPPDKHLIVNPNTHTLVQFRTIDFGMEKCSLFLRLPPISASVPHGFHFDNNTVLDVCSLDIDQPIDTRVLTWAHRPRCKHDIGTFIARPGQEVPLISSGSSDSYTFPCKWGTLHAFEISCSAETPQCGIDIWSNEDAAWGMLSILYLAGVFIGLMLSMAGLAMYQFQTV